MEAICLDKRLGNIIIQTPGGTAAKGSSTYKVSLPSSWIKELGIAAEKRQVELCFDGKTITISKRLTLSEFISQKSKAGHALLQFFYYDGDILCSLVAADFTDQTLCAENYVSDVIKTAFGNNEVPTWNDFQNFFPSIEAVRRRRRSRRPALFELSPGCLHAPAELQLLPPVSGCFPKIRFLSLHSAGSGSHDTAFL